MTEVSNPPEYAKTTLSRLPVAVVIKPIPVQSQKCIVGTKLLKFNPNLVILMPLGVFGAFEQAALAEGLEVCGLLGGIRRKNTTEICHSVPVVNRLGLADRFESEPASHFAALRILREKGLEWVGTYHSHPLSPPNPSKWDLQMALGGGMVDFIVGREGNQWLGRFWDFTLGYPLPVRLSHCALGPIWDISLHDASRTI